MAEPVRTAGPAGDLEDRPPRGWLRLLVDPSFGTYFAGRLLSSAGIWIYHIIVVVLAYELTGSAFVVGLVSVAQFLPQLVLAPLSGLLADRGSRQRQAIVGRLIVALGSSGLALLLELAPLDDRGATVGLVVSALVVGLGFVTGGPAMHAMVPSLVRRSEISAAVTLNTAPVTIARALGPAIGTGIALALGSAVALHVAAACNVGFAIALMRLRIPQTRAEKGPASSIRSSFAHLRTDPPVAVLLTGVAVVGIGADPALTLAPSIAESLGRAPSYTGTLATAFGIGAGLAFFVIPSSHRLLGVVRSGTLGFLLMAVGLGALVLTPAAPVTLVALGVAGLGMTTAITSLSSQLQQRLPDSLRGRIMALWTMAYLGSRPLAAAMDGAVADAVSVSAALVLVVLLLLGAAWLCSPGRVAGRGEGVATG